MRYLFLTLAISSILQSCILMEKKQQKENSTKTTIMTKPFIPVSWAHQTNIYEVNLRQYTPEGTFNAFATQLPRLKAMGVETLWFMPVTPIAQKNKKGTMGSYYACSDYTSINPEFGTLDDFKKLIKGAHSMGFKVILDWVANHTSWDHAWVAQHPDYYTHDKNGKMIAPFDWTDVAELDYNNKNLRKAMLDDMKYWLTEFNIDGFRCDVAAEVPTDFWDNTTTELNKIKPVFMLMEAEKPELMQKAFDMQYAWAMHHVMNEIAKGEKNVKSFDDLLKKNDSIYQKDDIFMNFTSNHDENSWNGTEYERMGDAAETFAALTFALPGMPLIYNGQEYDLKKRLKFFEKDTIPHTVGKKMAIYEKLGKLKSENPSLNGGKNPASYNRILTSDDLKILAFEREKSGNKIIFVSNLTKANAAFTAPIEGIFTDYMSGQKITFAKDQKLNFKPWEYKILIAE